MHAISNLAHLVNGTPLNTLQVGTSTKANSTAAASGSSSSSSSSSADDGIGSTFLSLLTQELQNQDPTDPVDSTAMVGQMISLNQLDQLISINQTLSQVQQGSTGSGSTSGTSELVASTKPVESSAPSSTTAASAQQLPFDPQTLMPVDMNHPGGTLATNIPGLDAATWKPQTTNTPQMAAGRN